MSKETWLTPYADLWMEEMGGCFNFGEAARVLRPVVENMGQEDTCKALRAYIKDTKAKYISISRFAQTAKKWLPNDKYKDGF